MSDHDDYDDFASLGNNLRAMGNLPSVPADPMPAIHRRIKVRRRARFAVGGLAVSAAAALVATAMVPAIGARTPSIAPAASPTRPTPTATPAWPQGGPGSVASAEFMVGLPVGSQVKGVGFEEFTAGKNGPGYVVLGGAGIAVVSYRDKGNGRPCLAAVGLSKDRPRFCLDGDLSGSRVRWKDVVVGFDVGGDRLLLMFTRPDVRYAELMTDAGQGSAGARTVQTKTSTDVRFAAYWFNGIDVPFDRVVGRQTVN